MGFNYYSWLFLSVVVVIFYMCIVKLLPQKVNMKLDYIGRNSMYYFVVHPIAREIGILLVPTYGRYIGMFIYLFICAFIVWLISRMRIQIQ